MKTTANKIGLIIAIISIIALAYIGKEGYISASKYEQLTYSQSQEMDSSNIASKQLDKWVNLLTLGLVEDTHQVKIDTLKEKREFYQNRSIKYAIYFAAVSLLVVSLYLALTIRSFTIVVSLAALIALINGLITPVLMVTVQKSIGYVGDIVLSFESKSIAGSIVKLYGNTDWVVASAILLFSVLIPLMKTLSILIVALFKNSHFASKMVKFFKVLGKWSMMDVFVVALFLVYLTSRGSDVSKAEIEIGLYFFLVYVLLSIIASYSADKMLHQEQISH